jgi:hypothetical protein
MRGCPLANTIPLGLELVAERPRSTVGRPRLYTCECDSRPNACELCAVDPGAKNRRRRREEYAEIKVDPERLERHRRQSREAGMRRRMARTRPC